MQAIEELLEFKRPIFGTALLRAFLRGQIEVVKRLMAAGANIEAVDREERNALSLASRFGHPASEKYLRPRVHFKPRFR